MKNIYSFLMGAAISLALWLPFSYDLTELPLYELIRTEEPKPTAPSLKKTRTYLSKSPLRVRREGMAALLAPVITATKTYAITNDTGLPGASANDELEYTIIISNSGDTDATGVSFTDQIDANTTLVTGSLKVSPIARNDNYTTIGNIGINISAGSGVLANDINPVSGPLTITTASPITTTGGGTVTLNTTTGAFTYEPAAGYTGNDTFTYTLGNGSGLTATATVTIAVTGKIWFVNNAVGSNGTGTLASPFQQLSDFSTANTAAAGKPADNDFIFIYTGSGNYTGSATLRNGQQLIGQGASASLLAITGYAAPSGTSAIPATAGTNPVLTTSVASTNALNLGSGNTLRGFTIGNTTGSKIAGSSFGTLTATELTLNGNGQALNLTNGTLAATFTSITSTNSAAAGISLSNVTGNLISTGGTTITNPAAQGIVVYTASAGTFNFGPTSLTGSGGTGLSSTGFANTLQFSSLTITPDAGQKGIDITGATGTLTIPTGSIATSNNAALSIAGVSSASRVTLGVTLTSVSVNSSPTKGISLTNTSGTFQVPGSGSTDGSGGTIQNITQRGAEFINATGITLKNINFISANTSNGCSPSTSPTPFTGCYGSVYLESASSVILDNININSTDGTNSSGSNAQRGITGTGVTGLTISNTVVKNVGNEVKEGAIFLQSLAGTVNLNNLTLLNNAGADDLLRIENYSTSPTITVDGSTFSNTQNSLNGSYGMIVSNYGTGTTNVNVKNSTFDRIRTQGVKGISEGTGTLNYNITNCSFDPQTGVGSAIDLVSNINGQLNFNILNNPTVKTRFTSAINVVSQGSSTAQGRINGNTVTHVGGVGDTGSGIRVVAEGSSTLKVEVNNNNVSGVYQEYGILAQSRLGSARLDAIVTNNSVMLPSDANGFGVNIRVASGSSNDPSTNVTCAYVANNITNTPGTFGQNFEARQAPGSNTTLILQSGTNATTVWNTNGNTPASPPAVIGGAGTILSGTCSAPTNPFPSGGRMMADAEIEQNQAAVGESVIPLLADSDNSSLLPATPAELVTPVVEEKKLESASLPTAKKTVTTDTRKFAREAATQAGETVTVDGSGGGFTLPAASSVTIKFKVTINSSIPLGTCQVSNQGTVSATGLSNVLTDDPAVGGGADPTVTPLKSAPVITTPQTAIVAVADPNTCTASRSFVVAVAGCPTPTVTYKIGATTITSPYAFPVGETTVDVTVSNGNAPDATSSFSVTVSPAPAPVIEAAGQPQNQTITVGGNASFTVIAQGTGLTYQWQKKVGAGAFTDIPAAGNASAATATLNLTAVPLSDNGTQYRVVVSNLCGSSTTSDPATLTVNPPISATISGTTSVCLGEATQPLITFTGADGTAPYTFTYKVNDGAPVEITTTSGNSVTVAQPTGTAGTYVYTLLSVKDAANVSLAQSSTATITVNPIPAAQISGTTSVCLGEATQPLITFAGADGTAPYTFTYKVNDGAPVEITTTSGNSVTVAQPTGTAGTYVYTLLSVKDANNCTQAQTGTATVTVSDAIILGTPTVNNVTCFGGSTGSISIAATGGTGTITYTLSPGSVQNATGSFAGLTAGTYSVTATDANSCSATSATITVTQPDAIVLGTPTVNNVACFGGSTGSISIAATGGTGTITYTLSPGSVQNATGSFAGLAAGTYSVTATDANSCSATSATITVTQPDAIVLGTPTVNNVACFGGSTGSISIAATGGTGTITYTLSPGSVQNATGSFAGLAAGTYSVTATDANSCSATSATITVTQPDAIVLGTPTVNNVACFGGSTGSISIAATGGTGTITYTLSPGSVQNATGSFAGLAAGTYSVTATDANSCSATSATITVTQPDAIVLGTPTVNNVACFGGSTGSIAITATGGTGTITYTLSPGSVQNATGSFAGLAAGTYSVTATDANSCSATSATITVTQPDAIVLGTPTVNNVTCFGGSTGSISIAATGGTGTITYTLSPGSVQNATGSFAGLTAGTYSVTATDANSCSATSATITVTQPDAIVLGTPTVNNVACFGGSTGSISIAATGGTGTITYTLSPGSVQNATGSFAGLAAGTYSVTATDANSCSATSATITVTQPNAISVGISGNTLITLGYGSSCTTLTASATGGTPGYTYAWSNGTPGPTLNVCPTQTTAYPLTVTDAAGCTVTKDVTVTVNDVRCGYGGVKMCLDGRESCIAQYLVPTYLRFGYTLGGCSMGNTRISHDETSAGQLTLSLKAYPNPTSGRVNVLVDSPSAGLAQFEVVDARGRAVQQASRELVEGTSEVPFDLTAQPGGNYLIRCRDMFGRQAVVRINKQ